jgi:hypothetical protein
MDIWEKWSEHYEKLGIDPKRICKDGIVNPDVYRKSSPKLLFILKEVNKWEGGDIRLLMKDGPKYTMAHNIARWSAAIFYRNLKFTDINNNEKMKEALSRVAVINLKKISGEAQADMRKISAYAFMDKDLLREQIKEIAPDRIIACSIFDILVWLLELEINPEQIDRKPIFYSDKKIPVIPWCHPSFRGDSSKPYNKLKELYMNMKKKYPEISITAI